MELTQELLLQILDKHHAYTLELARILTQSQANQPNIAEILAALPQPVIQQTTPDTVDLLSHEFQSADDEPEPFVDTRANVYWDDDEY